MPFFAQQRNGFVARLQCNLDYLRTFGHKEALLNMQPVAQLSLGHAAVRLKTGIIKRRDMNAIHRTNTSIFIKRKRPVRAPLAYLTTFFPSII